MEVHTHSHSESPPAGRAGKKWFHYLWEFLMLFLAVFCGFLAENLREHYVENLRAKEFAKSLYDDFKADTASIQRTRDEKTWILAKHDSALHILKSNNIASNNEFLYYVERYLFFNDVFTSQDVTYQQLKNSGSFRYFKNQELYKKIADYFNLYKRYQSVDGEFSKANNKVELRNFESSLFDPVDLTNLDNSRAHNFYDLALPSDRKLKPMINDPQKLKEFYLLIADEASRTTSARIFLDWLNGKAANIINGLKQEYHLK
ncbi:MAG TPA: hypothetical protein VG676_06550 [Chitinophagaceae bacterium]|jgi:hypothetical protein|nr:hypothetical protein [Chitinophagaceae bacterium]